MKVLIKPRKKELKETTSLYYLLWNNTAELAVQLAKLSTNKLKKKLDTGGFIYGINHSKSRIYA